MTYCTHGDVPRLNCRPSCPVEYGPARYRIVYVDGVVGHGGHTMAKLLTALPQLLAALSAVQIVAAVEPVEGTQYRLTHGNGLKGSWWNITGSLPDMLDEHYGGVELRSPVQS